MPRMSALAVAAMSTRESGSSTQSTGTSWMRRPARSATSSSSGIKEPFVVADQRQQLCGPVGPDGLKPHWASVKLAPHGGAGA